MIGVLVTHWHYDHLFGLAGFADLPSYAHASVADRLDSPEAADAAAKLGVDVADLVRPRNGFHLAKVIDVGGRRVEAMHFGPGHTDGDLAVFVPDVSVVFAGDLLESSAPPAIGPDSHLKEWPSAIDGILGVIGEESMVIPGHGPAMDRFESFKQRAELSGFYGQVEHVIGRGIAVEAAYRGRRVALRGAVRQRSAAHRLRSVRQPRSGAATATAAGQAPVLAAASGLAPEHAATALASALGGALLLLVTLALHSVDHALLTSQRSQHLGLQVLIALLGHRLSCRGSVPVSTTRPP